MARDFRKKGSSGSNESLGRQKRRLRLADEEEDLILDERWLLSYSDLMTLLFGLFVILYALSLEESHKFDSMIKSLAIGKMDSPAESSSSPSLSPLSDQDGVSPMEIKKMANQVSSLEKEIENLRVESEKLKLDARKKKDLISNISDAVKLKERVENEMKMRKEAGQKIESLEFKLSSLEEENSIIQKENQNLVRKLNEQKQEISEAKVKANESEDQTEKKGGEFQLKSYLSIMTYWKTKDHDVDLSVTTPSGKKYNFQNRKIEGEKGELILDSRKGPGAEIWHGQEAESGIYTINLSLYSQYENKEVALVNGHISTVNGVIALPEVSLDETVRKKVFKFRLNDKSDLELLP
ncbi:hypothetical protein GW916_12575 [bacterium]|nr:hypothetical protein [bacterium]